jgi:hypothetical protein
MRQKLNVDTLICIIRRFFSDLFPEADIRVGMVVTLLRQKVRLFPIETEIIFFSKSVHDLRK